MNQPGGPGASDESGALRLEVIGGNAVGSTIVVEDELVIGRHAEGAGRLAEDPELSRQHARITRETTGTYAIEDLGSTNGTFVKGLKIGSPELLAAGDTIEVGGTILVVRLAPAPSPAAGEEPAGSPLGGTAVSPVARMPDATEPAAGSPPGAPLAPGDTGTEAEGQGARPPAEPPPTMPEAEARAPQPEPSPPLAPPEPPPPTVVPDPPPPPPRTAHEPPPPFAPPEPEPPPPTVVPEPPLPAVVAPPPVTLRLEIDFASHEARMFIDDASEPIRLVHDDSSGWRIEPGSS